MASTQNVEEELGKAFQVDCERLLKEFQKAPVSNFETFCKLWQKYQLSTIFDGVRGPVFIERYVENCFTIIEKFLHHSDPNIQVGALFLLFGVYTEQPAQTSVKIRLTKEDYLHFKTISKIDSEAQFIFKKLKDESGFHYVVTRHPFTYKKRPNLKYPAIFEDPLPAVLQTCEKYPELVNLDELEVIEDEYSKLAQKISVKNPTLSCSFSTNLAKKLREKYEDKRAKKSDHKRIADLNRIKQKAMSSKTDVYKAHTSCL